MDDLPFTKSDATRTQIPDCLDVVADDYYRPTIARDLADPPKTFRLERYVTHRQNLVDDQDLRLQMCSHGECQADLHPAGEPLYGRIQKLSNSGELDNLVELSIDLLASHAQDRSIEVHVLPAC